MSLWMHWWKAIWRLRPAFSRFKIEHTFKQAVRQYRCVHLPFLDVRHEATAPQ